MRSLCLIGCLVSLVVGQDGTCVSGQDPIGQEQSCLGRCHVYYEGNYGACGDQVTAAQVTRNCGDSIQNPCISTFNAAWDNSKSNCGNCYYVEMDYSDGVTTSVYLKTIDTNASETKFEMMQYAWEKLCPILCAGSGTCGHSASYCTYGVLETNWDYPGSCAVQYAPVRFKRVDCNGGGEIPAPKPTTTSTTSTTRTRTTTPRTTTRTTTTTPRTTTRTTTTTTTTTTTKRDENEGGRGPVQVCQESVYNCVDAWDKECKAKCEFYNSYPKFCGDSTGMSGSQLASCVKQLTGYC